MAIVTEPPIEPVVFIAVQHVCWTAAKISGPRTLA